MKFSSPSISSSLSTSSSSYKARTFSSEEKRQHKTTSIPKIYSVSITPVKEEDHQLNLSEAFHVVTDSGYSYEFIPSANCPKNSPLIAFAQGEENTSVTLWRIKAHKSTKDLLDTITEKITNNHPKTNHIQFNQVSVYFPSVLPHSCYSLDDEIRGEIGGVSFTYTPNKNPRDSPICALITEPETLLAGFFDCTVPFDVIVKRVITLYPTTKNVDLRQVTVH